VWDDNNPVFVDNSKGILFESNRMHDTIKANEDAKLYVKFSKNNDVFFTMPLINLHYYIE